MIDPKREAEAVVAGERTSTPVSGKVVDGNRAFARRGIAVCALIVFGAFFIWGGWGRAKPETRIGRQSPWSACGRPMRRHATPNRRRARKVRFRKRR